ncbi:MAG TPA: DUF969 family protein [Opitutaceae bacterium]
MIKLLGLLLVAVGFALRINTLLVVVAAAMLSGLLAGMSFHEIVALMGRLFVDNRGLTLPVILMVPVVGILERHGLQERVAALIRQARAATAGRVAWIYQVIRAATSMVGLNIGNHASMVRPLIAPMAEGAAEARQGALSERDRADIRAHAAAAENAGNFFADDIVVAIGALLLVKAFFDTAGVEVSLGDIKAWSLPTGLWVIAVGWWRYRRLDARLAAGRARKPDQEDAS